MILKCLSSTLATVTFAVSTATGAGALEPHRTQAMQTLDSGDRLDTELTRFDADSQIPWSATDVLGSGIAAETLPPVKVETVDLAVVDAEPQGTPAPSPQTGSPAGSSRKAKIGIIVLVATIGLVLTLAILAGKS